MKVQDSFKKVAAVIPARMGASRFPGKPLAKILDLPMIEHVRRRVQLSNAIDEVYVATCDREIYHTVMDSGGKALMTKDTHERCTDRVEEAASVIDADIIVIVQGDEPLFFPDILEDLVNPLLMDEKLGCVNLISVIQREEDLQDEDIVKAALDEQGYVMFFSRAPIPYKRVDHSCPLFRQTGVSAFSRKFLSMYSSLKPTSLEIAESVDFLRIIGHRYLIKGVIYDDLLVGVDREDDIGIVEVILNQDAKQKKLYQRILSL